MVNFPTYKITIKTLTNTMTLLVAQRNGSINKSVNMKVIYQLKSISYCIVRLVMKRILDEGLNIRGQMQNFNPNNDVYRIVEMRILSQKKKLEKTVQPNWPTVCFISALDESHRVQKGLLTTFTPVTYNSCRVNV